jgi:hypothetical protein
MRLLRWRGERETLEAERREGDSGGGEERRRLMRRRGEKETHETERREGDS